MFKNVTYLVIALLFFVGCKDDVQLYASSTPAHTSKNAKIIPLELYSFYRYDDLGSRNGWKFSVKKRENGTIPWHKAKYYKKYKSINEDLKIKLYEYLDDALDENYSESEIISKIKGTVEDIDNLNYIVDGITDSPLGLALKKKKYKIAQYLVKNGASVNLIENKFNKFQAIRWRSEMSSAFSSYTASRYYEEDNESLFMEILKDSNRGEILETLNKLMSLGLSEELFNESRAIYYILNERLPYKDLIKILESIHKQYPTAFTYSSNITKKQPLEKLTSYDSRLKWTYFHSNTKRELPALNILASLVYSYTNEEFTKLADFFVKNGADLDFDPGYNLTPFALTCVYSLKPDRCEYYLDKKINLNIQSVLNKKSNAIMQFIDYYKKTPKNHKKYFSKLLKSNIDINFKNINNDTALTLAIQKGKFFETKALINAGADVKIVNDDGYSALDFALKKKHKKMIELVKGGTSGKQTGLDKLIAKKNAPINYNAFALVIGINKYMNETNVDYADNSAKSFAKLAQNVLGVPKENIISLTNEKATSGQIKSNIELITQLLEKGNTLYFYYAGHGVPGTNGKTYLLPSDMKADNIEVEPALAISTIYDKLIKSPADNVVVFMDSCFSGKDDSGKLLYKGVAPVLKTKKQKINKNKMMLFSAGASSDFANQYKDQEQRLFSYFLMKGLLEGKNTTQALHNYTKVQVKRNSLRLGLSYKQIPQFDGKANYLIK